MAQALPVKLVQHWPSQCHPPTLYETSEIPINEDVWIGPARWIDLDELSNVPLYPDGLAELLQGLQRVE